LPSFHPWGAALGSGEGKKGKEGGEGEVGAALGFGWYPLPLCRLSPYFWPWPYTLKKEEKKGGREEGKRK